MRFINTVYAAETAVDAVESKTSSTGGLSSLGINADLFVAQLINFVFVATIIWFLILKPLTKKMAERQKLIDESLTNAKKVEANLQKSEQKYQERIDHAKVEANKILERTTTEAEQLSVQMKEKAKKEIELLVDQAKRNIKIERDEMAVGIKKEAANLVVMALEKILSERVDSKKDKELIEEMVAKVR